MSRCVITNYLSCIQLPWLEWWSLGFSIGLFILMQVVSICSGTSSGFCNQVTTLALWFSFSKLNLSAICQPWGGNRGLLSLSSVSASYSLSMVFQPSKIIMTSKITCLHRKLWSKRNIIKSIFFTAWFFQGSTPWASNHCLGICYGWSCNKLMDKSSIPPSLLSLGFWNIFTYLKR